VAAADDAKGTVSILEARIEYRFSNPELPREALIHTIELPRPDVRSNARLAFLGDALVKLIVGEALYRQMADAPQGVLTKEREKYESKEPQAAAARDLGLDRLLTNSVGRPLPEDQLLSGSAPATVYEAVVAAVYLDGDGGPQAARDFVWRTLLAKSRATGA